MSIKGVTAVVQGIDLRSAPGFIVGVLRKAVSGPFVNHVGVRNVDKFADWMAHCSHQKEQKTGFVLLTALEWQGGSSFDSFAFDAWTPCVSKLPATVRQDQKIKVISPFRSSRVGES